VKAISNSLDENNLEPFCSGIQDGRGDSQAGFLLHIQKSKTRSSESRIKARYLAPASRHSIPDNALLPIYGSGSPVSVRVIQNDLA